MNTNTTATTSTTTTAFPITVLSNQISFYFLIVMMPLGIVLNIISIFIFMRPSLNKTNMGFIFTMLALVDTISLFYYFLVVRPNNVFGYTVNFFCGMSSYLRRTIFNYSSWIQAYVSVDRFVSIYFPSRAVFFKKKTFSLFIMLAILCLVLLTNFTNLMTYPVTQINPANNRTSTTCFTPREWQIVTPIIAMLMRICIPFAIMIIFNTLISMRLFDSKKKILNRKASKEYRFALVTLSMDIVFFLFYLPVGINLILNVVDVFSDVLNPPQVNANFNFYSNISQLIAISYHAIFFIINMIFNSLFRNEFFSLFRKRIQPVSQTMTQTTQLLK
jgi:hypothetical protein